MFPIKFLSKEIKLLCFSFFCSLVIGAIYLEFYFKSKYSGTHNRKSSWFSEDIGGFNVEFDSALGWVTIPNNKVTDEDNKKYIPGGKTYTTNSFGFRSKEVDLNKKHLIALGDSITWGSGVNDNETMPYFLEKKLEKLQVLNLGVPAYGLDQEYLYLKRNIGFFSPKYIVVTIYTGNDISDTSKNVNNGKSKPLFVADRRKVTKPKTKNFQINSENIKLFQQSVSKYSCANIFSKSWLLSSTILSELKYYFCDIQVWEEWEMLYVTVSILLKLEKLASQHNSKILFVLTPSKSDFIYQSHNGFSLKETFNKKDGLIHFRISKLSQIIFQDIFSQLSLESIDYYQEIKNRKFNLNNIYIDNMHFSPEGNRLLAETIASHIKLKLFPLKK